MSRLGQLRALKHQKVDRGEGPSWSVAWFIVVLYFGLIYAYVLGVLTGPMVVEFLR